MLQSQKLKMYKELLALADILAKGAVIEAADEQITALSSLPTLISVITRYEELLDSLPKQGRYCGEILFIRNELAAFHDGRYHENPLYERTRGIPRVSTIGGRVLDRTIDLIDKIVHDKKSQMDMLNELGNELIK